MFLPTLRSVTKRHLVIPLTGLRHVEAIHSGISNTMGRLLNLSPLCLIHFPTLRKAGAEAHEEESGYNAQANAGTGFDLGEGVSLDLGLEAESTGMISSSHLDIASGVGVSYGANVDEGFGVGVGITSGIGISGGLNEEEANVGGSVLTPAGTFGIHVGCTNKICFFGCLTINFC